MATRDPTQEPIKFGFIWAGATAMAKLYHEQWIKPPTPGSSLIHYTSLDGLKGIVEDRGTKNALRDAPKIRPKMDQLIAGLAPRLREAFD